MAHLIMFTQRLEFALLIPVHSLVRPCHRHHTDAIVEEIQRHRIPRVRQFSQRWCCVRGRGENEGIDGTTGAGKRGS